ncbi:DUF2878 domain-containing protein [Marinobacter sp. HL-58]|uniref:DUF2878 domain-containing protein n=1 Tax=Marinobacter sp. HL-58 TaxID=1479237 RepID=UPI000485CA07|nr:DUF2878 domain-containing protein [Marinobacter sp. HL-58]KPQ01496.1 MAG: Protein of unknown function (DUF2878) [Marinobacter sp. HL-58]
MIQSDTARKTINFVLFQAGWLVCVLYPSLLAAGFVALLLVFHIAFISKHRLTELQFIGAGTVIGGVLDGIWFRTGVLDDGTGSIVLTPIWLVGIWAIFMTTLSHSLSWISSKAWLPFVCAPVAGPFAYWSASKLGAVQLPDPAVSLVALAAGWLVVFPALLYLRKYLYPELAR